MQTASSDAIVIDLASRYPPRPCRIPAAADKANFLMRADIEAMAADIEQSIGLLRRRL
jgi:hypothetical protein